MWTEIVALISVVIAVVALLLTLWQNVLTRRAAQAEVFITLQQFGDEMSYDEGIRAIGALENYGSYATFCSSETEETHEIIYKTVKFLTLRA